MLDRRLLPSRDGRQKAEKSALITEAQRAANPEFFLRLYNGSNLLLLHQFRQGQPVRHWRVLVFCPSRELNFGDPVPVAEFLRERVLWIELAPDRMPPSAPPLQKAFGLLLLPEKQLAVSAATIRQQAAATPLASDWDDVIAAILPSRLNGRSITEICAMGGITLDDFTNSVAYREIYGLGRQAEAAFFALRQLKRRCGSLAPEQQTRVQALPLADLEALSDALLDFQEPADLTAWMAQRQGGPGLDLGWSNRGPGSRSRGVRGLGGEGDPMRRQGCWPLRIPRTPPGFAENPSVCVVCRAALRHNASQRFPQS